jgi:hypothetical protein
MQGKRLFSLLLCGLGFFLVVPGGHSWTTNSMASFRHVSPTVGASKCFNSRRMAPSFQIRKGQQPSTARTQTSLYMSYNLPPGNGGSKNDLGDIGKSVLGLALVVGFFVSPLGGLFFGLLNSFLFLAFLTPVVGIVGFQVWRYLNMLSAPCPNCGSPANVFKSKENQEDAPSICFNCGAILQASYDNKEILNVSGKNSVTDDSGGAGNPFGGSSIFDLFGVGPGVTGSPTGTETTTPSTTATTIVEERKEKTKSRRESTIIDVEVEDEDKPFQ